MRRLSSSSLALALAFVAAPMLSACASGDGTPSDDHPALALDGDSASGETLFATHCAGCHGADGQGGSGPDLSDEVPELSDNDIAWTIAEGEGSMPAIDLEDQEIADVLAFLRATFGN